MKPPRQQHKRQPKLLLMQAELHQMAVNGAMAMVMVMVTEAIPILTLRMKPPRQQHKRQPKLLTMQRKSHQHLHRPAHPQLVQAKQ
jgi:hypothetical protein